MLNGRRITPNNLPSVQEFHSLRHRWVTALAWSNTHDILAVANAFDTSLYRFEGGGASHIRITGHTEPVRAAAISPDGHWLITGGDDSRIGVWNIAPDQPNHAYLRDVDGPVINVASHPTHEQAVYAIGSTVYLTDYSGENGAYWPASERDLTAVGFSPDGNLLLATGWDGVLRAKDLRDRSVTEVAVEAERINAFAFNHAGNRIATVNRAGRLSLYAWPSAEFVASVPVCHDAKAVDSVAFAPDDTFIATGGRDHLVRFWRAETLEELGQLAGHRKPILAIVFGGDGQLIVTGSGDNTVRLWKVQATEA